MDGHHWLEKFPGSRSAESKNSEPEAVEETPAAEENKVESTVPQHRSFFGDPDTNWGME